MTDRVLLSDETLEASSVVANNAMNRERGLAGVNSYAKDLGFDPLAWLRSRIAQAGRASWLDLCCGTGKALVQASRQQVPGLSITGVDLTGHFDGHQGLAGLKFITASVTAWEPDHAPDLITCVHGLHYVGDKLGTLARAMSWLADDGLFAAHLDLGNIKTGRATETQKLRELLRTNGIGYDVRRRLITRTGPARFDFGYAYIGADDRAGPNYTGQPAVDSHYSARAAAAASTDPR